MLSSMSESQNMILNSSIPLSVHMKAHFSPISLSTFFLISSSAKNTSLVSLVLSSLTQHLLLMSFTITRKYLQPLIDLRQMLKRSIYSLLILLLYLLFIDFKNLSFILSTVVERHIATNKVSSNVSSKSGCVIAQSSTVCKSLLLSNSHITCRITWLCHTTSCDSMSSS